MLMRFAYLDREGNFGVRGDLRVLYAIMLFTRIGLHGLTGYYLSQAATISLRYAAVRRQFSTQQETNEERRLIDYQAHQFKLLPSLAISVAFILATK